MQIKNYLIIGYLPVTGDPRSSERAEENRKYLNDLCRIAAKESGIILKFSGLNSAQLNSLPCNLDSVFASLKAYDKVAIAGKEILEKLDPKYSDKDISLFDLYAKGKLTIRDMEVTVLQSLSLYMGQGQINNFVLDVRNFLGNNQFALTDLVPNDAGLLVPRGFAPEILPIAKFSEAIQHWRFIDGKLDEELGFDFETNGLPLQEGFRPTGVSLSNDKYQVYFYFSRENDEYHREMELYGKEFLDFCVKNQDHLWAFNSSFENNVIYHLFKVRVFFQDARVLTQLLKTRGSLKYSAHLFLGVPIWNEDISNYQAAYNTLIEWVDTYEKQKVKSVVKTVPADIDLKGLMGEEKSQKPENLDYLTKSYIVGLFKPKLKEFLLSLPKPTVTIRGKTSDNYYDPTLENLYFKYKHEDGISRIYCDIYQTGLEYCLAKPDDYLKDLEEAIANPPTKMGALQFLPKYKSLEDSIDPPMDYLQLLDYIRKGYTEWQVTPYGKLGYYCCLDSFYTIKLKEKVYDSNFQGCKNGYQYFITQDSLGSMLDSNGVEVDIEFFNKYKDFILGEYDHHLRAVATHPLVVEATLKYFYEDALQEKKVQVTSDVLDEIAGGKRVFLAIKNFVSTQTRDSLRQVYDQVIAKVRHSFKELGVRKFSSELPPDEKTVFDLLRIYNTNRLIGILEQISKSDDTHELSDKLWQVVEDSLSSIFDLQYTEEDFKQDYLHHCETMPSYQLARYLLIDSNTAKAQSRFFSFLLEDRRFYDSFIWELRTQSLNFGVKDSQLAQLTDQDKLLQHCRDLLKKYPQTEEWVEDCDWEMVNNFWPRDVGELDKSLCRWYLDCATQYSEIAHGKNATKSALSHLVMGMTHYFQQQGWKFTSLEDLPSPLDLIWHYMEVNKSAKAKSTLVYGALGSANFLRVRDPDYPISVTPNLDDEATLKYLYRCHYQMNSKDTLRTSSTYHTIPPGNDFSVAFKVRGDDRMMCHMDMSQSEARLAFALSGEKSMVDAMLKNLDLHSTTANRVFNLGYSEDELYKVKKEHNNLRQAAKAVTFSILYGAGAKTVAENTRHDLDYAKGILDQYLKGNPHLNKFIEDSREYIRTHNGYIHLPIFDCDFWIENPYSFRVNQKALNYQIQNISSSICAHIGYLFYRDLKDNYGVEIKMIGFVHDALEFDFHTKDFFIIYDRMKYWFHEYQYDNWGVPSDYDAGWGVDKFTLTEFKVTTTTTTDEGKVVEYEVRNINDENQKIIDRFTHAFPHVRVESENLGAPLPDKFNPETFTAYLKGDQQKLYSEGSNYQDFPTVKTKIIIPR